MFPTILIKGYKEMSKSRTVNTYIFQTKYLKYIKGPCVINKRHTYYAHNKCQIHLKRTGLLTSFLEPKLPNISHLTICK